MRRVQRGGREWSEMERMCVEESEKEKRSEHPKGEGVTPKMRICRRRSYILT